MAVRRRPFNRLFQSNEYRIFQPSTTENAIKSIPFHLKRHPNREMGTRVTIAKDKTQLLKAAAEKAKLELVNIDDGSMVIYEPNEGELISVDDGGTPSTTETSSPSSCANIFLILPKEILLLILSKLNVNEISEFVKTSRYSRNIAYDNLLWKEICYQTWYDPTYLNMDLQSCGVTLRLWYNWNGHCRLSALQVIQLFEMNIWRLIYIALHSLDFVPSIVYPPIEPNFFRGRATECYGTIRNVKYKSTVGEFRLEGVTQVSRVEYTVFNHTFKPWHRNEYKTTRPIPIFDLKQYGLKATRSIRGQNLAGFFHRRGYYLKTDLNRKVHLAYRYFPTVRLRLYQQDERVYLLCQDIFMNNGEMVDCYTMYEVILIKRNDGDNEDEKDSDSVTYPAFVKRSRGDNDIVNRSQTI